MAATLRPDTLPETSKPKVKTRVYQMDPRRIVTLTDAGRRNARYMTGEQLRRLTANVAEDGELTSVPLLYNPARRPGDPEDLPADDLIVVSGNHRVGAAVAAGLAQIWVMEVVTHLPEPQVVALQLSHNAITGQDDPSVLFDLYDALDLDLKKYTGLTDDAFKLPELDLTGLSLAHPDYQEVTLMFLPAEANDFKRILADIEKRARRNDKLMAQYADFDRFFDTLCRAKDVLKVYNTAVALRLICDLATDHLDLLEAQEKEAQRQEQKEADAPIVENASA